MPVRGRRCVRLDGLSGHGDVATSDLVGWCPAAWRSGLDTWYLIPDT